MSSRVHRGYITFTGSYVKGSGETISMQYFSVNEPDGALLVPPASAIVTSVTGTVTGGIRASMLDESSSRYTNFYVRLRSSSSMSVIFESAQYRYPTHSSSYGNMNSMNGPFSMEDSHSRVLTVIRSAINTSSLYGWASGFTFPSDDQAVEFQNNKYDYTVTINYTWTTYDLDPPTVSVTPVRVYSDDSITFTVQDYAKQKMSNGNAALTLANTYRSYYIDDPSTIVASGNLTDLNVTSTADTTNRIWQYTVTPPWDLRLCYQFSSQLIDTADNRQNSSVVWSQQVVRAARVTTPLQLELTSLPKGNSCSIRWRSSSVTGATTADLYYRIRLNPTDESAHYIYVQHVDGETYQTYEFPNISKYFSASHQSCTITVQAVLTTRHLYPSAESNSVYFTWIPHSIVRYYDDDTGGWAKCSLRRWVGTEPMSKILIERYMAHNYYSSVDLLLRPLVSQADIEAAGWTTTYAQDTLCPQTFFDAKSERLLVLTPLLDSGSIMDSTTQTQHQKKLIGKRSPSAEDWALFDDFTVVDWVDGVTTSNYAEQSAFQARRIALLQTLQQIYYIDAPAAEATARAAAEANELSPEETEAAVEAAMTSYYDSLSSVYEEMQAQDRSGVTSGWAVLNPFVWTGSAWRQCTF